MNAILGMTNLTLDTDLSPGNRENLEVVCLAAGMDGFSTGPIHEEKLIRVIAEDLTRGRQAPPDGAGDDDVAESYDPMDLDVALERVDGDRAFLGEMAAMFLAEAPGLMSQIRDALAQGELASLVAPAHNLKNWAGNFAASVTSAELARLETFGRAGQLAAARASFPELERELGRLTRVLAQSITEPQPPDGDDTLLAIGQEHRSPPCTLSM
jgi:HPt (histidine-containing phosphotransfer) domain-containing protein